MPFDLAVALGGLAALGILTLGIAETVAYRRRRTHRRRR